MFFAMLKYHMDQNGLQPRDLIPFIGSPNRVHETIPTMFLYRGPAFGPGPFEGEVGASSSAIPTSVNRASRSGRVC